MDGNETEARGGDVFVFEGNGDKINRGTPFLYYGFCIVSGI